MVSTLMIFTLLAALVVGIFLWGRHMRKPENRHPMEGQPERNIGDIRNDASEDTRRS